MPVRESLFAVAAAEVAVAVAVVDLGHVGEELGFAHPCERECRLGAGVGMCPFAGDLGGGVRRVGDHVVGLPRGGFAFALDAHQRFDAVSLVSNYCGLFLLPLAKLYDAVILFGNSLFDICFLVNI